MIGRSNPPCSGFMARLPGEVERSPFGVPAHFFVTRYGTKSDDSKCALS